MDSRRVDIPSPTLQADDELPPPAAALFDEEEEFVAPQDPNGQQVHDAVGAASAPRQVTAADMAILYL